MVIGGFLQSPGWNWVIGGFLLATASFLVAVLFIVQTWIMKDYPAEMMVALISCIFASIQAGIVALIVERDPNAWKLRPDIELLTIAYSAIFVIAFRNIVYSWALHNKGPVFVTMIKPLGMVIAIIMGVIFLRDTLSWKCDWSSHNSYWFLFRMEKLELKAKSSHAKSIGTMVSIAGALIVTFYKGQPIIFSPSVSNTLHEPLLSPRSNWIIGGFLLAIASFLLALLFIVQAIVGVSLRSIVHIWALHKKGPVFVTMFKPLGMVFAVAMGITFLGDTLHIGSVIGAAIIALGFYSVMWGKAKEERTVDDNGTEDSSSHEVPLLQNKSRESVMEQSQKVSSLGTRVSSLLQLYIVLVSTSKTALPPNTTDRQRTEEVQEWGTWVSVIIAVRVAMECLEVGWNTLSKSAMRGGMSSTVFVVYSNAMAIVFLLPSTFIFHRYSSPTVASAMTGLTPGLSFILATLTGMEKLDLKAQSRQAKSIGAIISIAGAFIVTFYQGPPIMFSGSLSNVLPVIVPLPRSNWIIGSFLLATVSFLVALVGAD
ncbi:hypothetical protein F0562_033349 [Nyssa sinensis]|uniref:EamA domain-containing protein n=1 Tax=Nyssa sinensis TaxID=561372 RepID=A0A5J5AS80_9ASTE|nr:hypothetical protein F0562_033349 [Nyssa sinensis]